MSERPSLVVQLYAVKTAPEWVLERAYNNTVGEDGFLNPAAYLLEVRRIEKEEKP